MSSKKYDLILVTETWLKANLADSVITNENYNVFRCDRTSKGGGVALFINKSIPSLPVPVSKFKLFEIVALDLVITLNEKLRVVLVYFPPKCSSDCKFTEALCCELIHLCGVEGKIILLGDFNFPNIDWRNLTGKNTADKVFLDFSFESKLFQVVDFPSRGNNFLDLIFASERQLVNNVVKEASFSTSDHSAISFSIDTNVHVLSQQPKLVRDYFKADYKKMNAYFANVDWRHIFYGLGNIDSIYKAFLLVIHSAINLFVPFKKPGEKSFKYPQHIVKLMEYRSKLWRSTHHPEVLSKFQEATKNLSFEIVKFQRYLERKKFLKQGNSFFNFIGRKIKPKNSDIPLIRDGDELVFNNARKCDLFASQFNLVLGSVAFVSPYSSHERPAKLLHNVFISDFDMYESLRRRKNKLNTTPDFIPDILLKNCALSLAYPIACICRLSLSKGAVPQFWKQAIIIPLFKKGDHSLASNYRPISLTSSISKTIETFIKNKLVQFFNEQNIIPEFQHGFRDGMGVVTQMLEVVDDWSLALERKNCIDIVYFDIKSAFDAINHERLSAKLFHCGVQGQLLQWIKNFLNERKFTVKVGDNHSPEKSVLSGVPQGSVLGPLLFNFYMHDIFSSRSFPGVRIKSFADDTKAYIEFDRNDPLYPSGLQDFINYFSNWSIENGLTIAISKCRILHVGRNNPQCDYYLGMDLIPKVSEEIRDLGIYVTPALKWGVHIRKKCRFANAKFFNILKAFKSNDPKFLVRLYTCYVRPILEFASPVFNSEIVGNINMIESVQRRVSKAIFRRCFSKTFSCPPSYEERLALLGLEKLQTRFLKLDLILVHQYRLGLLSKNSSNGADLCSLEFKRNRSSIFIPSANNSVRNNSFFVRAFKKYTKLPPSLLIAPSVDIFRGRLNKTKLL